MLSSSKNYTLLYLELSIKYTYVIIFFMKNETGKKIILLIFACVFVAALAMNFMTPLVSDDFAFSFDISGKRISNFEDIFNALKYHRQNTNGRVLSHFFVYLFLLMPKWVFNIVNATFTVITLYLFYRFVKSPTQKENLWITILLVCGLWSFAPAFGDTSLWLTGSCNYMWGLLLDLLFVYPYFRSYTDGKLDYFNNLNVVRKILFSILAFAVGIYSENGSVTTIALSLLLLVFLFIENKEINFEACLYIAIAVIGFAFLLFAPATSDRTNLNIFGNLQVILEFVKKYCLALFVVYALLLVMCILKKADKKVIIASLLIIFSGLISFSLFIVAVYVPARGFMIATAYEVLAVVLLAREVIKLQGVKLIMPIVAVGVLFFGYKATIGGWDIISSYRQSLERNASISMATEKGMNTVELKQYRSSTRYSAIFGERLYEDWYNDCIATYYGFEKVIPIVEE